MKEKLNGIHMARLHTKQTIIPERQSLLMQLYAILKAAIKPSKKYDIYHTTQIHPDRLGKCIDYLEEIGLVEDVKTEEVKNSRIKAIYLTTIEGKAACEAIELSLECLKLDDMIIRRQKI